MPRYKIIKPYSVGTGSLQDAKGNMIKISELAPKVGNIIEGEIRIIRSGGDELTTGTAKGIIYPIKTDGVGVGSESLVFIPETSLEEVKPNSAEDVQMTILNESVKNKQNQNVVILRNVLVVAVILGLGYILVKGNK